MQYLCYYVAFIEMIFFFVSLFLVVLFPILQIILAIKHSTAKYFVTINLTKTEIAYNSSGSNSIKWLQNTLLLTFKTTIHFWLCIGSN